MTNNPTFLKRLLELYSARYQPESVRPLGLIMWHAVLALVAIGIIAVVFYAIIIFTGVVESLNSAPESTKPSVVLDRSALDSTIREIRNRGVFLDIAPSAD